MFSPWSWKILALHNCSISPFAWYFVDVDEGGYRVGGVGDNVDGVGGVGGVDQVVLMVCAGAQLLFNETKEVQKDQVDYYIVIYSI